MRGRGAQLAQQQPAGLVDLAQIQQHLRHQGVGGEGVGAVVQHLLQQPAGIGRATGACLDLRAAKQRFALAQVALLHLGKAAVGGQPVAGILQKHPQQMPMGHAFGVEFGQPSGCADGRQRVAAAPLPMRQGGQQAGGIRKPAQPGVQGGVCGGGMCQQQLAFGQLQVQLALFGGVGRVGGDGVLIVLGGSGKLAGLLQQPAGLQQARAVAFAGQRMAGPVQGFVQLSLVVQCPGQPEGSVVLTGVQRAGPAQAVDGGFALAQLLFQQAKAAVQGGHMRPLLGGGPQQGVGGVVLAAVQQDFAQRQGGFRAVRGAGVGVLGQAERLFGVAQRQLLPGLGQQGVDQGGFGHVQRGRWVEVACDSGRSHTTVNRVTSRFSAG